MPQHKSQKKANQLINQLTRQTARGKDDSLPPFILQNPHQQRKSQSNVYFCLLLSHSLFLFATSSNNIFFCNLTSVMMSLEAVEPNCIASIGNTYQRTTSSPYTSSVAPSSPSPHQHSLLGPPSAPDIENFLLTAVQSCCDMV